MVFVNNYSPEPEISEEELYGPEPYDLNFILPVPPVLSTDKLRLVPFIPRVHATVYSDGVRGHETIYQYMPRALEYPSGLLRYIEMRRRDETAVLFAAIDTTRPDPKHPEWEGSLAGMFGLLQTDKTNLVTDIGPAIVLPAFQRTHVASPCPQRMGFKFEGLIRWTCVMSKVEGYQKDGKEARAGDARDGLLGRDSNELAVCWDDWEEGGRELVEQAFARVA
ncbi:hypothetical protein BU15DRAFT_59961 [Melanogaster broomeanus]|nr:hypothetical protein BU15DRAFT_59961 [Melanogaster broomeanus]